jgi:hypothetical protein
LWSWSDRLKESYWQQGTGIGTNQGNRGAGKEEEEEVKVRK